MNILYLICRNWLFTMFECVGSDEQQLNDPASGAKPLLWIAADFGRQE